MKKKLIASIFCLFIWTQSVPSVQAWFWSSKSSAELSTELNQLKSQKSQLETKQAKLKETIATGKANNDTIEELEKVRKELKEIQEDIDETYEEQVKTAGEEQRKKREDKAASQEKTQEAIAEANQNISDLDGQKAALKKLKLEEKKRFLAMNDCDEVGDCDEVKESLKKIQSQIKKTENNIATLQEKLEKNNSNININDLLTSSEQKQIEDRKQEASDLLAKYKKNSQELMNVATLDEGLKLSAETLLENSPTNRIGGFKDVNIRLLSKKISATTDASAKARLNEFQEETISKFVSLGEQSSSVDSQLDSFIKSNINPCIEAKEAGDEEAIAKACANSSKATTMAAKENVTSETTETGKDAPQGTATATDSSQKPYSYKAETPQLKNPVFSGLGLVGGATVTESRLDNHISKERDLKKLIIGWTRFIYPIAALLAVVAIIWAGFLAITARGDDGQIETAKKIVMWVVIGIIAMLSAYAVVNTVMKAAF